MTPVSRINAAAARIRESFAMGAARAVFNDRRPMFIAEDPDKFAPGNVVVEDGKPRRMMITKIVVGFAECIWWKKTDDPSDFVHTEIVHTSMLTLDADQKWKP